MDGNAGDAQPRPRAVRRKIAEIEGCLPLAIFGFRYRQWERVPKLAPCGFFPKEGEACGLNSLAGLPQERQREGGAKNRTQVCELLGYGRLEEDGVAETLKNLYANKKRLFRNVFCPVIKLVCTEVRRSRRRRIYDEAMPPFQKLKAFKGDFQKELDRLEKKLAGLDPSALGGAIERKLREVWKLQKSWERKPVVLAWRHRPSSFPCGAWDSSTSPSGCL